MAALLGISAGATVGCGAGGGATPQKTPAASKARQKPTARAQTGAEGCDLGGFLHSLDTLQNRLAVGLSYGQYFEEVTGARSAYTSIRVARLELPCLAVGAPGERALDQYIEAANVWRACRTDVRCATYTIEPRLQHKWRVASHDIAQAHEASG